MESGPPNERKESKTKQFVEKNRTLLINCCLVLTTLVILLLIFLIIWIIGIFYEHIDLRSQREIEFEEDCQIQHNIYRRRYHAPPLKLMRTFSNAALKKATKCATTKTIIVDIESSAPENIYIAYNNSEVTGKHVVTAWFNEGKNYTFTEKMIPTYAAPFTQIIWYEAENLGCGIHTHEDWTVAVCIYREGNEDSEIEHNLRKS